MKRLNSLCFVLLALSLTSCGKTNRSGGGSSSGTVGAGVYAGVPANIMNVVRNENPCTMGGGARRFTQVPLANFNANFASYYVGVTSYGDIGIITMGAAGQAVMHLEICPRAGATGQGSLMNYPQVNYSPNCQVSEISRAEMMLQPNYNIILRPIYYGRGSSLCR